MFAWLALVAGVGAPLLLNALVRRGGATRASSHLFVVPAVTALAAWPLLGTPLGPLTVVGLLVVVVALSLATGRIGGPKGGSAHERRHGVRRTERRREHQHADQREQHGGPPGPRPATWPAAEPPRCRGSGSASAAGAGRGEVTGSASRKASTNDSMSA